MHTNMENIIGRQTERKALNRYLKSGKTEFVALYGRRRVGKTFLIKQHFNNKFDFYMSGTIDAPKSVQLSNFRDGLVNAGLVDAKIPGDAKKYFSNPKGVAHGKWRNWLSGEVLRQDYLETALDWISGGAIEDYMGKHQHDSDATELRLYFENVMNWTKTIFPNYRKEMKSVQWGKLYNRYKDGKYSAIEMEKEIAALMANDEVQKKSGIYEYVLSDRKIDKMLNPRDFSQSEKRTAYERQEGVCPICGKHFEFEEMHGDHIVPWSKGCKTELSNLQILCTTDNIKKSNGL